MRRVMVMLLVISMLLSGVVLLSPASGQDKDIEIFIVGPDALEVNAEAVYTVTVVGPYESPEDGKWNAAANLEGENLTGGSPTLSDRFNVTQEDNVFRINLTAPSRAQKMKLAVEGGFNFVNGSWALKWERYSIHVVDPINLRATVSNPSNSTLKNVLVNFRVDGELIGSSTIEEIGPFGEGTATYSWVTKSLSPGKHDLGIEIDLNGDGIIDETRGETLEIQGFYSPEEGPNVFLLAAIVILVFLIIILLPSTIRKKKKRKQS